MTHRDAPTLPPPDPSTQAQRLREQATEARIRATRELHMAIELEQVAASIERGARK